MILEENMHVVMKKDIIQDKCASLGCQTLSSVTVATGSNTHDEHLNKEEHAGGLL